MVMILILLAAYLLGSIPFSLIIGKRVKGIDLREHGSGNLGATNVYRNLGAWWGGLCLVLDMAKGLLAVLMVSLVAAATAGDAGTLPLGLPDDVYRILGAVMAILGHSFSPFAGFKGGKGIATTFGAFLILEPFPILIAFGVFLAVFFATRIVSLGSISAAAVFPWAVLIFEIRSDNAHSTVLIVFSFVLALLVIWRHRANIKRLQSGTESRLNTPQADLDAAARAADATQHDILGDHEEDRP
jgi:glycerol-3-phosphate acyltransferase PlsY